MTDDFDNPDTTARRDESPGVSVNGQPLEKSAGVINGAYEGADRLGRELASWRPAINSADNLLSKEKMTLDGRAADLLRNNGPTIGASNTQKDSIVGAQYRLNANPAFGYLAAALGPSVDEVWAEEFQREVEETFTLYAESDAKWIDVERKNTLTGLVRLGIGCFFAGGDVVQTMNWMTGGGRPYHTAMQMVDANRVCNPNDYDDTKYLRRGLVLDDNGALIGVHIRRALANDRTRMEDNYKWDYWPVRKRWGRLNLLYIMDAVRAEQSRGVAELAAALKETRMGKRFHEVALANAIVQASFAAAIESELPPDMAYEMIGAGNLPGANGVSRTGANLSYLQAIAKYSRGSRNVEIDGAKIPYLFPGSKLKLTPAGSVGGMGDKLEQSLNRYISASLGISYEEYTHDYSQTNYSSLRAAMNKTLRGVTAKKRVVADGIANAGYQCWLEEAIVGNTLECTKALNKRRPDWFYERMNKEAVCRATWIGATRGQVDELKETQAAVMRIASGLSTYEIETARLGYDFRDVYAQQQREKKMRQKAGLEFDLSSNKPSTSGNTDGKENTTTNGKSDDGFDD